MTKIDYRDPDNRSSLERMRNYELALKKAGFELVYKCANEECGPEIQLDTIGYYPPQRYLTARLKRPEGDVWVGVFVKEGPWTKIRVVEEQPMETDMVSISADQLKNSLAKEGHMAVYGILFDTGKAEIKPASAEAIKEIAVFLTNNPSEQIYVVGHTDNIGKLKNNMELSSKRAAAVVTLLTTTHKIEGARLEAAGVGPLAPIASNATKKGQDLNRRVEIVMK